LSDSQSGGGIVPVNVVDDALEVGRRIGRPSNLHLRLEHLFKGRADFLVGKKLPAVEPAQAGGNLPPEPSIVIEIILDKLLNVVVRGAAVLRSHPLELRWQFRRKVDFHRPIEAGGNGRRVFQQSGSYPSIF
jgi:hypothetical protein